MTKPTLTQDQLKKLFHYDPETGNFTRLKNASSNARAGDVAGYKDPSNGYVRFRIQGTLHYAHRLVWLYVHGSFPEHEIDHINHNKHDNRLANLRHVSHAKNGKNQTIAKNNTSGHCGVWWSERQRKWAAEIRGNQEKKILGYFPDKSDAIAARLAANVEYGYHENHGT